MGDTGPIIAALKTEQVSPARAALLRLALLEASQPGGEEASDLGVFEGSPDEGIAYAHRAARLYAVGIDGDPSPYAALASQWLKDDSSPLTRLSAEMAGAWSRLAQGRDPNGRHLAKSAQAIGSAPMVIEATCLRALYALENPGDRPEGLKAARRASLMARTESLPLKEYLAALTLARARRLTGRPHLALRILFALDQIATLPYQRWAQWERILAGGRRTASLHQQDLEGADARLSRLLEALFVGHRGNVRLERRQLRHSSLVFFADRDLDMLLNCALIDQDLIESAHVEGIDIDSVLLDSVLVDAEDPEIAGFLHGELSLPPRGLFALALEGSSQPVDPSSYIYAPAHLPARRVMRNGLSVIDPAKIRLDGSRGTRSRTEAVAGHLAMAGSEGLAEEELFERVWGFKFAPVIHRPVLDVVLHRLRAELDEGSDVVRVKSRVTLHHNGMLIADPASVRAVDERVLAELGRRGGGSAKDAAGALELPLRTVQHALKRLAEEGACVVGKEGRRVLYRLEDTVFSEPTQSLKLKQSP